MTQRNINNPKEYKNMKTKRNNRLDHYIKIQLASPQRILKWSERLLPNKKTVMGEVRTGGTFNYRTFVPEKDGLFCEKIFGPVKDWECQCGRYKRSKYTKTGNHPTIVCPQCEVEVTESRVRRYRMGYIKLASPVTHLWFLKNIPSYISIILGKPKKEIKKIVYFQAYLTTKQGSKYNKHSLTSTNDWNYFRWFYSKAFFNRDKTKFDIKEGYSIRPKLVLSDDIFGAQAIQNQIRNINLPSTAQKIRSNLKTLVNGSLEKNKQIRRLRILNSFIQTKSNPEWMILTHLPILPPALRPFIQLPKGNFAISDLNELYRRIINRNNRLTRLTKMLAPEILIRNEKRLLQESVDSLINNNTQDKPVLAPHGQPIKSLSERIKGKKGRFRQNLLGKRVDYSGRSVIVVNPELKLYECGLPREMAIELFQPFVVQKLIQFKFADHIRGARQIIKNKSQVIWIILSRIIKGHPILLNRAPTLHRLGIQAFQPKLVLGRAIELHPLVCAAFNADFDGDQMAVHIPLSLEAQAEARVLMLASNNWTSPATGEPIVVPSQDMVLGCYFLTLENVSLHYILENIFYFNTIDDVLTAYRKGRIKVQTFIWIKIDEGNLELTDQEYITLKNRKDFKMERDFLQSDRRCYIRTTPGRVIFNQKVRNFL